MPSPSRPLVCFLAYFPYTRDISLGGVTLALFIAPIYSYYRCAALRRKEKKKREELGNPEQEKDATGFEPAIS